MDLKVRRVVTGHDADGKAIVVKDSIAENIVRKRPGYQSCVLWATEDFPADNDDPTDGATRRRTFLESDVAFERVVVHGHTPTAEVHSDWRRVGIDTKAYSSGRLTALRLIGAERSIVEATLSLPTGQDSGAEELVVIDRRPLV